MIEVKFLIPNMPRLETEKPPPSYSLRLELLVLGARWPAIFTSLEICDQALGLRLEDDRRDQAEIERHGDADIGMLVAEDARYRSSWHSRPGCFISAMADAFTTKSLTDSL